jgi:hypothetical protein
VAEQWITMSEMLRCFCVMATSLLLAVLYTE